MKYIILIIISSYFLIGNKWELVEPITDTPISLLHATELDNGFAFVAHNRELFIANDTTFEWESKFRTLNYIETILAEPTLYNFVYHNNNFFCATDSGYIFKSEDYGENWEKIDLGISQPIQHLKFVNDNVGFVGRMSDNLFYKTTDGGDSWEPLPDPADQLPELFGMYNFVPVSENEIYWIGGNGDIDYFYQTVDGGKTWEELNTTSFEDHPQHPALYRLLHKNSYGFICEQINKPDADGGINLMISQNFTNWEPLFKSELLPGGKFIKQIKYYNNIAIALGTRVFLISKDGGNSWIDLYDPNDDYYINQNPVNGFFYKNGVVYAPGFIQSRQVMFRFQLDNILSTKSKALDFNVFPNPSKGIINIDFPERIISIEVLDINGNSIDFRLLNSNQISFNETSSGYYFLRINDKYYKKIILEE